jgi:negative regulator of flagellin synthesis FlgM
MRIDAAFPLPENQQTSKMANSGSSVQQNRSVPAGSTQDQAQLSAPGTTVQQLKANLSQVPEVRQDRVDAVRQSLASGTYQVSDQQLSDAMGSDLLGRVIG